MIKNIFFDLDGTLTDPKEGITKSVAYALEYYGIHVDDLDKLIDFIGPPLWDSFKDFYGFDDEKANEAVAKYRERFCDIGLYENAVYDGIEHMLSSLKDKGYRLAVATSKPTIYSKKIVKHFKLDVYFEEVVGSEMDGTRVKKEDVISYALETLNMKAEETIMVGDRRQDIKGAIANNMRNVGVLFGYGSREEFEQAGADYVVESVAELEEYLKGINEA
ncbi:MAG: HAD family hydrolase [Lachnospiraceae bacterium]|nr:HAD family hydrolase [Lachnospiraceae bacterium]